jgi:hypothetical protein
MMRLEAKGWIGVKLRNPKQLVNQLPGAFEVDPLTIVSPQAP